MSLNGKSPLRKSRNAKGIPGLLQKLPDKKTQIAGIAFNDHAAQLICTRRSGQVLVVLKVQDEHEDDGIEFKLELEEAQSLRVALRDRTIDTFELADGANLSICEDDGIMCLCFENVFSYSIWNDDPQSGKLQLKDIRTFFLDALS
jgi:hypothetical protein